MRLTYKDWSSGFSAISCSGMVSQGKGGKGVTGGLLTETGPQASLLPHAQEW